MSCLPVLKLLPVFDLLSALSREKRAGKKIVFTNGCFDILHAGHVKYLQHAKALGDLLVVGINSDASVRRIGKGPGRPINPLKDRMWVLAALSCVDVVVPFSEETPEAMVGRIRPDVLVKGGDYRPAQVAGRRHAKRLVLVPLKKGYSTTRLLSRIRR